MTKTDLQTLCEIADAAGQEIMAVYHSGGIVGQKEDSSPLTEADLRADRVIRRGLEKRFPHTYILSEESSSAEHIKAEEFFLVDPLDGTKEFLKRNGEFTVNIALIKYGQPVAGVVLAPALNEMFFAARGLGAWKRSQQSIHEISCLTRANKGQLQVVGSRSHGGKRMDAWVAKINKPFTFVAIGSSLKFCRIAEGQADIYPRFGPTSQWDTAAAQAVLETAGGHVVDWQGRPLKYGLEHPILNPEFVALSNWALCGADQAITPIQLPDVES